MSGEDRNPKSFLNELKKTVTDEANTTIENIKKQYGLLPETNKVWPQTQYDPEYNNINPTYKSKGFLPPTKIEPTLSDGVFKYGNYIYRDWRGVDIVDNNINKSSLGTADRFERKAELPSSDSNLQEKPYSTRDYYTVFNDSTTDYFKHGLQVIDNASSFLTEENYGGTPFENNDPIIYGFDIIIDDLSSPLLNGSIDDFIRNYSSISEVAARASVYMDFKKQFSKFFKTKSTLDINDDITTISNMSNFNSDSSQRDSMMVGSDKRAYMNYYLKKIGGLDKLVEQNTPSDKKYLTVYNKDVLSLSFSEDVTMSMGTLAHLYKLLYWSKPNGKGIIPENLLRFNCDIIVSEIRNYKRVIRVLDDNSTENTEKKLKVIKDNVSRYVYSLRECQFYFNSMPVPIDIDMSANLVPFGEGGYSIQFDYKYSTVKLERFIPNSNGFGKYVGYNGGAIWRLGSANNRASRSGGIGQSIPRFKTMGDNSQNKNGVNKPFILNNLSNYVEASNTQSETPIINLDAVKSDSNKKSEQLKKILVDTLIKSSKRELQTFINTRTALLNKTLGKIFNAVGANGITPPRNIYTDAPLNAPGRIFYDVRGQLINFVGSNITSALSPRIPR